VGQIVRALQVPHPDRGGVSFDEGGLGMHG
jgi:hypothetical protein